jgi:hypothetical protein
MLRSLAPAVLALALLAAPAQAANARLVNVLVESCGEEVGCRGIRQTALVYEDSGATANRLTLRSAPGGLLLHDAGTVVHRGRGCSRVDARTIRCRQPEEGVFVSLGDGDDTLADLTGPGAPNLIADGGRGADMLAGGQGHEDLYAGPGRDILRGGAGVDTLHDTTFGPAIGRDDPSPFRAGARGIAQTGGESDLMDGGPGVDTVSYEERRDGVLVDLAQPVAAGEDLTLGLEGAIGGAGRDRLAGDARANQLSGNGGRDRLVGRKGSDLLNGGEGADRYAGGPGGDRINPLEEPGTRERIRCGAGTDLVFSLGPDDYLAPDCEEMSMSGLPLGPDAVSLLPLREGRPPALLRTTLGCFAEPSCSVTMSVTAVGTGGLLARRELTLEAPSRREVTLALSSEGLALLRRSGRLRVRVEIAHSQVDLAARVGYLTVLRAPR